MRIQFFKVLWIIISLFFIFNCGNHQEPVDRSAEIREVSRVIDANIGWFKNKDFELSFGTVAQDEDYLSVHPTDRVVRGFARFKKNAEIFKKPGVKYLSHEIRDLRVKLSRTGRVAWFYCVLDDIGDWEGTIAGWKDTRWTGVLEKREGRWVIVQQHFSFAHKK